MVSYLIFQTYSKAKKKNNALFTKTVERYNYDVTNETSHVLQHGFNNRTNFTQQSEKRHVTTKQVPLVQKFYMSARKRDGIVNYQKQVTLKIIVYSSLRLLFSGHRTCRSLIRNKIQTAVINITNLHILYNLTFASQHTFSKVTVKFFTIVLIVANRATKLISPRRDWGESYEKHLNFRAECKLRILLSDASKNHDE